ncbi:hypothetical protein [Georgenia sp. Z1491]
MPTTSAPLVTSAVVVIWCFAAWLVPVLVGSVIWCRAVRVLTGRGARAA